ncbi:MAG: hypothetical protein LH619_07600 [Chitinophagaceae bacterium]|nr:hypothetical protein [Chitinophagaceae bacterium]
MKIILIPVFCLALLYACSGADEKNKPKVTETEINDEDNTITNWLKGKEWKAENGGAPMSMLKLNADGIYETGNEHKDPWYYKVGNFILQLSKEKSSQIKWPLKKIDDKSFTLYIAHTNSTFVYKFVKTL